MTTLNVKPSKITPDRVALTLTDKKLSEAEARIAELEAQLAAAAGTVVESLADMPTVMSEGTVYRDSDERVWEAMSAFILACPWSGNDYNPSYMTFPVTVIFVPDAS